MNKLREQVIKILHKYGINDDGSLGEAYDELITLVLDEVQTGIDNKVSYETRNYLLKRDDVNSAINNLRGER